MSGIESNQMPRPPVFDSMEDYFLSSLKSLDPTAPVFNSMDDFLASLKSQDFDSSQIPSSRDLLQSLDFPNNAIFNSRSWAYGVHSLPSADDLLAGKMPLNGSSNVQDQPWGFLFMNGFSKNPVPKTLQLPRLQPALPTECIPSGNEAALQEVAQPPTTTPNKRRRVYKARRVVPETKVYVDNYKDKDVLSGRGARTNKHSGNRFYLELVEDRKPGYRQASDKDKRDIVDELIKTIHGRNGQFLEMEQATKRWYVSHEKMAYTKVSQALRDQNDEESRAAKRARYSKSAQPQNAKKAKASPYASVKSTAV